MGWINSILEWSQANHDKKIAKMKEHGKCPDCKGVGINAFALYDYYVGFGAYDYNHCLGCNGSGSFSDWEALWQQK